MLGFPLLLIVVQVGQISWCIATPEQVVPNKIRSENYVEEANKQHLTVASPSDLTSRIMPFLSSCHDIPLSYGV